MLAERDLRVIEVRLHVIPWTRTHVSWPWQSAHGAVRSPALHAYCDLYKFYRIDIHMDLQRVVNFEKCTINIYCIVLELKYKKINRRYTISYLCNGRK